MERWPSHKSIKLFTKENTWPSYYNLTFFFGDVYCIQSLQNIYFRHFLHSFGTWQNSISTSPVLCVQTCLTFGWEGFCVHRYWFPIVQTAPHPLLIENQKSPILNFQISKSIGFAFLLWEKTYLCVQTADFQVCTHTRKSAAFGRIFPSVCWAQIRVSSLWWKSCLRKNEHRVLNVLLYV